jgi:hypothetical protein
MTMTTYKLTPEQIADLAAMDNGDGLAEAMRMAIEARLLVDSGERRDGRIVWERTSKMLPDNKKSLAQ